MFNKPVILSSATLECFFYIAHDKNPRAFSDPECQVLNFDHKDCPHVKRYMTHLGEKGQALVDVGHYKSKLRGALNPKIPLKRFKPLKRHKTLCVHYPNDADRSRWRIRASKKYSIEEEMLPILYRMRKGPEAELKRKLNDLGKGSGLKVDNTGLLTVLRFLNDLEMKLMTEIVAKDAPECSEQLEKFHQGTERTYKTVRYSLLSDNSSNYSPCVTPEPVRANERIVWTDALLYNKYPSLAWPNYNDVTWR